MTISEIFLVGLAAYCGIQGFAYFKAKGKAAYSLLIPVAFSFCIAVSNFVFRYRLAVLHWSLAKSLAVFASMFAIMTVCMTIPMGIAVLASKVKARKNEKSI